MATNNNTIELLAALDKAQSVKNINKDIDKIRKQIKPLELQVKPDVKSLQGLDSVKKDWETLFSDISKMISESISSQMSGELKEAESATGSSLSNMLGLLGTFAPQLKRFCHHLA